MSQIESSILPPKQPLTNRKKLIRAIVAAVLAIVLIGGVYAVERIVDFDWPAKVNTAGMIAAVQYLPKGSQVVLIKPGGTVVPSPGYNDGQTDREPVWRPDGNRLMFVSDREPGEVNLYRWNPGSNHVERRSETSATYTHLIYSDPDPTNGQPLVASGGKIVTFDAAAGTTAPVLPPTAKAVNSDEGNVSSMEAMYGDLGTSFQSAVNFGVGYILAILRGDRGDTLIVQSMKQNEAGQFSPPMAMATGDRIDIDYNRNTGAVVYSVQGFRFPDPEHVPAQFVKNGRVITPFRHELAMLDPNNPGQPIVIMVSQDDKHAFAEPRFSPDGSSIVVSEGPYASEADVQREELLRVPASENGGANGRILRPGAVFDPSFSSDGKTIAFVVRDAKGAGAIHLMNADGSGDSVLTPNGNFGSPRFSPQ